VMAMNVATDGSGTPAAADVEALFNACVRRTFSTEDIKQIQLSCQKLSSLCQVSSFLWNPQQKVFHDFRQRQAADFTPSTNGEDKEDKKSKKDKKKHKKKHKKSKKGKKGKKHSKKDKKKHKKQKKKDKKEHKKAKKEEKKSIPKKDRKQAKKDKKEAKKLAKKAKKEEKKSIPKKDRRQAKKEKKEAKKQAKKDKKHQKEQKKAVSKLGKETHKLEKKERDLAKKILKFVEWQGKKDESGQLLSPSQIETKLDEIQATLQLRDKSISRFAPCLIFTKESGKDALDSQCAILKKATELTLQSEECWAGYLSVVNHCKHDSHKKKKSHCYETFATANSRCGGLAARGRTELQKLLTAKEQPDLKK